MKLRLKKLKKVKLLICISSKVGQTSATYSVAKGDDVITLARELADDYLDGDPFIFDGVYRL